MQLLLVGHLHKQMQEATKIAQGRGAKVIQVENDQDALNVIRKGTPLDLIMIDVDCDIQGLIQQLETERIHIDVVACGIGQDAKTAVKAIKAGAKEYIPLPPDAELIAAVIEAAAQEKHDLIFQDTAMESVIQIADKVANSNASILITGESGTGKEVMARYVHRKSQRNDQNFVSVNCAAIPENLLESELFGHEKGAFTGAVAQRIGKFEQANGGTLLLDEISEMDPKLQAKLLRVIQEKEIERVGGDSTVPVNVRLVATSNRNLEAEIREGTFREDLYFRLNVINLKLPPLRQRPKDMEALAMHFADKYCKENDLPALNFSDEALELIRSYPWPGNVRELENTIHRAVLMATGMTIDSDAILLPDQDSKLLDKEGIKPESFSEDEDGFQVTTLADAEKNLILDTLDHCLGNRTHAAKILGISIRTLRNKLNEYSKEQQL